MAEKRAWNSLVRNRGVQHRHRRGPQEMIERVAHLVGREILLQIEMRHLAQGMHAGIGAARARDRHALAGKFLDGVFQRALHRRAIVLALPADKGAAVIFQGQAIAHQEKRVPLRQRKALEQLVRRHQPCRRALDLEQLQRTLAAGDGEIIADHFARRSPLPVTGSA